MRSAAVAARQPLPPGCAVADRAERARPALLAGPVLFAIVLLLPAPAGFISTSSPLRAPVIFSITAPEYSSSTSMVASSMGSIVSPSISFMITCGREIESSKPSRRMFSISTPIWSSPRP